MKKDAFEVVHYHIQDHGKASVFNILQIMEKIAMKAGDSDDDLMWLLGRAWTLSPDVALDTRLVVRVWAGGI